MNVLFGGECVQGPEVVESDLAGFSVPLEHSFEVGEFRFEIINK